MTIRVDGRSIEGRVGESLAAAMTAAGLRGFRTTAGGAERGLFCGMGVCQECVVEVDGRPNQLACMTKLVRPIEVRREGHRRPLPPAGEAGPPVTLDEAAVEEPEILVIGGGPAGLAAALAARQAGAEVVLLDERAALGGQYFKQLAVAPDGLPPPDRQHRDGAAWIDRARAAGVQLVADALVWGAFPEREFLVSTPSGLRVYRPGAAVIATGAYERGWPVPGWALPGVMTTGAAQTLWRTARRLPGRRVLVAGNGPLNLQLAAELLEGGATVVALVEAAASPGPSVWRALGAMAAASPDLVAQGLRYRGRLAASGVSVLHASVVAAVEAEEAGLRVTVRDATGSARVLSADTLCLGYGFEPSNELLRALGCRHDFDPGRGHLATRREGPGATDVPGVFAAGDCTGLGGARAALCEGTLAGIAAAVGLGHATPAPLAAEAARAARALARHRRFQRALWRLYAPAIAEAPSTPDTVICRCEEVTRGEVERALEEGPAIGAVKRRTRAGMGRCQGRYCGPALQALIAAHTGIARGEYSGFAPRLPVKPVAIEDIARLARP